MYTAEYSTVYLLLSPIDYKRPSTRPPFSSGFIPPAADCGLAIQMQGDTAMPIPVTKILLVEDNPGDARLLQEALVEIAKPQFKLIHRETMAQALEFLAKSKPDAVLLDLGLPDSQGLDTVRQVYGAS